MSSPGILDIVPERVAQPLVRAPWRTRLLFGCGDTLLSLVLNGTAVGFMIGVGWPVRDLSVPQAISVELVDRMPAAAGTEVADRTRKPGDATGSQPAPPPEPARQHDAAVAPDPLPAHPEPAPPSTAVEPPSASNVEPEPGPEPSKADAAPPQTATPPTPEHPDDTSTPRLVEAPRAPASAPSGPERAAPSVATDPPAAPSSPEPQAVAEQPPARTPDDADAVPAVASPPAIPAPLTAEQQRQAETTAKLAAALPFGADIRGGLMQAPMSVPAQAGSTAYRGQVYANLSKAQDVIEEARSKHLKGQAVVAFTVGDNGELAKLAVAVSSGNAAVDQAALELIRRAAPFPPPPPGAQRSFSPAIGLGLHE